MFVRFKQILQLSHLALSESETDEILSKLTSWFTAGNAKETVKTWKELECLILTSHYAQVGNCDSDFFIFWHRFCIMSLKFLKFKKV